MKLSLRRQLMRWLAVVTVATGLAAGAGSFLLALREAHGLQDDQLRQVALLAGRSGKENIPWGCLPGTNVKRDRDGRIMICPVGPPLQASVREHYLVPDVPAGVPDGLQTIESRGVKWRLFVYRLPSGLRIAACQMTEARDEIAVASGLRTLIPILLLFPALTVLSAWVIWRALMPVANLSRQLDDRGERNLSPLSEEDVPCEIAPFVTSINALMQRLDEVLAQQRRFIADASHELRSPLTALAVQAENLRNVISSPDAIARVATLKSGLDRSRKLLEQLLSFARHQSGSSSSASVCLDEVVRQVIEESVPMALAKRIDLGCERLEQITVTASAEDLAVLVRNAVDNAVRYTQAGGVVDIALYSHGDQVVFEVLDSGPGIPPDEEARVFEPFYRIMGNTETGSGLGLAIIRTVAEKMGGTVTLVNRKGVPGAEFRYAFTPSFSPPGMKS